MQLVEFGNAGGLDTRGTGWFVGFSDWTHGPARRAGLASGISRMLQGTLTASPRRGGVHPDGAVVVASTA